MKNESRLTRRLFAAGIAGSATTLAQQPAASPAPPAAGDLDKLTARAFKERPELVALAEQARALHEEAKGVHASAW